MLFLFHKKYVKATEVFKICKPKFIILFRNIVGGKQDCTIFSFKHKETIHSKDDEVRIKFTKSLSSFKYH